MAEEQVTAAASGPDRERVGHVHAALFQLGQGVFASVGGVDVDDHERRAGAGGDGDAGPRPPLPPPVDQLRVDGGAVQPVAEQGMLAGVSARGAEPAAALAAHDPGDGENGPADAGVDESSGTGRGQVQSRQLLCRGVGPVAGHGRGLRARGDRGSFARVRVGESAGPADVSRDG